MTTITDKFNHPLYFENLTEGMEAEISHVVSEEDISQFAQISGDTNPVHLDEEYASKTRFKQRIAHGMLSASFISAVFGTRMPGLGAIYVNQSLRFKAPVHIGDEVIAKVVVTNRIPTGRRVAICPHLPKFRSVWPLCSWLSTRSGCGCAWSHLARSVRRSDDLDTQRAG